MTNGLSKLAVLASTLLTAALLVLSFGGTASAEVRKTSFELDGDLSRFDQVNLAAGTLSVGTQQAFGSGTFAAHATYLGGNQEGYARGVFNVNWRDADDVWYDAAFYLPVGFKAAQRGRVDLLTWDNWPSRGTAGDYGGIVMYGYDHKARLVHGSLGTDDREDLTGPFDLPEGRWFFIQVHQRFGGARPFSEVYVDSDVVGRSTAQNMDGDPIDRVRAGLVSAQQENPLDLWLDRVVVKTAAAVDTSCPWPLGEGAPSALAPWPPGCWRPFSNSSPFNDEIPADAVTAPRSQQTVQRLLGFGPVNDLRAGIADTSSDYYHPVYYAKDTDPLYLVTGGSLVEPYAVAGKLVHLPAGARPAAGSDHHLAVIDDGYEWGFWNAQVDHAAHVITGAGTLGEGLVGRKVPLSGSGLNASCTAARFPCLAGIIRAQELAAGEINHSLFMTVHCTNGTGVYPSDITTKPECTDPTDAPPMGARFQLNMSDAQIDALPVPAWKKTILRAMAHYGLYVGDITGSPWGLIFESGSSYTSFGQEDEMVKFAQAAGVPNSGGVYNFDIWSDVDWAQYLRVIDPCITQGTC